MVPVRREMPAWFVSLLLHLLALGGLGTVHFATQTDQVQLAVESFFSEEDRTPEEFTRELDTQQEIAENLNFISGGPAGNIGGTGAPAIQQTKIDNQQVVKDPQVAVNVGTVNMPGIETLGNDLGAEQITGEIGAVVEGYGAALDRITQELIRLMRKQKVLVVWLFDESESMKDDQEDLKGRIHRVYEELKLVEDSARDNVLLTSIVSYGEKTTFQLHKKKPTTDPREIMAAIDRIPIDRTGLENTCQAIGTVIGEYRKFAIQGHRKLVLIVVSDESGDDGQLVDETLHLARNARSSIYVLGREAVFGYPYAHIRWVHPQTHSTHYLPIHRGPETPFAEQLQFDGFQRRRDAAMSGFGPYEQVRLARDTGGIFFLLPNEEQNINDYDARKYAALDMKEYVPEVTSRREYSATRDKSEFRRTVWEVILALNPYDPKNKEMEIPIHSWYSPKPGESGTRVASTFKRCLNLFGMLSEAQTRLERVRPLREREASRRWRANYDLILAQVMAYRVRIFQYMIAIDQYNKSLPTRKFHNPKSNAWTVRIGNKKLVEPDSQQLKVANVSLEDLEEARSSAVAQFQFVVTEHPQTPWSIRATWELGRGFGMSFAETFIGPPRPGPKGKLVPVPKL